MRCHVFLAAMLAATPAFAEAPEGETLHTVDVQEGWGDGRVTERDARAFCEFCVWGVNALRERAGDTTPLEGDEVIARMHTFWEGVWDYVELETKQTISAADVLWPAVQERLAEPAFVDSLTLEFAAFAEDVWGGYGDETLAYLDGSLSRFAYELIVSQQIEAMIAASRPRSMGGSVPSFSPYGDTYRDDINTSYVINDGSGDVMYIDE